MKRLFALCAIWFLGASILAARGDSGLLHARQAQALLGPGVWSRVIRVENTGRTARYPSSLHALVFELAGSLWFYTDFNGTQSFSLVRGRLEEEKADFAPLLLDIDRGFTRWTVLPDEPPERPSAPGALRKGCFVESVANLRRHILMGEVVRNPKLLSYYPDSNVGGVGHTVLTYETAAGVEVIDPDAPAQPIMFARELARDALALGRALVGRLADRAVWVSVGDFANGLAPQYATTAANARGAAMN